MIYCVCDHELRMKYILARSVCLHLVSTIDRGYLRIELHELWFHGETEAEAEANM